jgi:hypothetical protein
VKRIRFSLRLIFLIVALVAVCCATLGVFVKLKRIDRFQKRLGIETRLELLMIQRKAELRELQDVDHSQTAQQKLRRTDAAIAETREILAESLP